MMITKNTTVKDLHRRAYFRTGRRLKYLGVTKNEKKKQYA